jgi:hypothetical protein
VEKLALLLADFPQVFEFPLPILFSPFAAIFINKTFFQSVLGSNTDMGFHGG